MKLKYWTLTISCLLCWVALAAQSGKVSYDKMTISTPLGAEVNVSSIQEDWAPIVKSIEMPSPTSDRGKLRAAKEEMMKQYANINKGGLARKSAVADDPILSDNFDGNPNTGSAPNDNDIAISNDGILVSVVNSNIFMIDTETGEELEQISLSAFGEELGLSGSKYDPRVLFDPEEERFIIMYLSGTTYQNSNIIVAFSKNSDPTDDWYKYALDGNPLDNDTWSDYGNIALSESELFIGFNTYNNGSSNNSGYVESVIWQIDKFAGYFGNELVSEYYSNISYDDNLMFNFTPVAAGNDQLYGSNMYILSNRTWKSSNGNVFENDTMFLINITDDLAGSPEVEVTALKADIPYYLPAIGRQPNDHQLDTNDGRVLGAFYQDGYIEFVMNTTNLGVTGYTSIYHGVIEGVDTDNPSVTAQVIGDDELDLAFPDIAYTGQFEGDRQSIIIMNHSSSEEFPGGSAIFHSDGEYSDLVRIKEGESFVDLFTDNIERWGDYTGIQPKYDEPGVVWAGIFYGKGNDQPIGIDNYNATWIAKLESPQINNVDIEEKERGTYSATIYPNPFNEMVHYEFDMPHTAWVDVAVYDSKGQMVKMLIREELKVGDNRIQFSAQPLKAGTYFLIIKSADQTILKEKIIKQ